jgi:DNA-binding MarR family transcriptional regulator
MSTVYKTVATLAARIGRNSPFTVALVFARVASAGGAGLLQATVQREFNLAPAVVTKIVQTLVALDLISRWIETGDSRYRVLRLTEKGRALVESISESRASPRNSDVQADS